MFMTNRTWVGGDNNQASNPSDWSPKGAPQPGDILTMSAGTMNINDNDLHGDQLTIAGFLAVTAPVTLNLSHVANATVVVSNFGNPVTVNVTGLDSLSLSDSRGFGFGGRAPVTVNMAEHSVLFGTFNMGDDETLFTGDESLTISGSKQTTYINNGLDKLIGSVAKIDPNVVGTGEFVVKSLGDSRSASTGSLEFGGFVSGGQTIELTGAFAGPFREEFDGKLKVDDPRQFHGTIVLHDLSLADLVGLAQADTWSYSNDLLTIRAARGGVIDTLRVVSDAPTSGSVHGLTVSKTGAGDVLISPGTDFHGAIA